MKKLLSLFYASSIISTASSSVVACTPQMIVQKKCSNDGEFSDLKENALIKLSNNVNEFKLIFKSGYNAVFVPVTFENLPAEKNLIVTPTKDDNGHDMEGYYTFTALSPFEETTITVHSTKTKDFSFRIFYKIF